MKSENEENKGYYRVLDKDKKREVGYEGILEDYMEKLNDLYKHYFGISLIKEKKEDGLE